MKLHPRNEEGSAAQGRVLSVDPRSPGTGQRYLDRPKSNHPRGRSAIVFVHFLGGLEWGFRTMVIGWPLGLRFEADHRTNTSGDIAINRKGLPASLSLYVNFFVRPNAFQVYETARKHALPPLNRKIRFTSSYPLNH